jgi:hypothetical protein
MVLHEDLSTSTLDNIQVRCETHQQRALPQVLQWGEAVEEGTPFAHTIQEPVSSSLTFF